MLKIFLFKRLGILFNAHVLNVHTVKSPIKDVHSGPPSKGQVEVLLHAHYVQWNLLIKDTFGTSHYREVTGCIVLFQK